MAIQNPDYGYVLVAAAPTAQCPFCHRLVRLVSSGGIGTFSGGCPHVREMSRIEGTDYVEFVEQ